MIKFSRKQLRIPYLVFSACVCGIAAFCYFILCTYEWRGTVYMGKFS